MDKVLEVRSNGNAREVGRDHAEATMFLRDQIVEGVERVKSRFPITEVEAELAQISKVLKHYSPDTLDQISGMAEVFQLSRKEMLLSVLQTYFQGRKRVRVLNGVAADQGCSTYAYSNHAGAVLVKNRDTSPTFLGMQTLLHVSEPGAFAWSALSTAGAPGVHSAGINEHGLGVVDTHVPSANSGPGVPRFSMMMNMLQRCRTVVEAIALHQATPSMGYGNMVLQDVGGHMVVIESGYHQSAYRRTEGEFLVATNHFVSEEMESSCLETPDSFAGVDTRERAAILENQVREVGDGLFDDPLNPMRLHEDGATGSICVHDKKKASATISSIVIRPRERTLALALGNPCQAELIEYAPWE